MTNWIARLRARLFKVILNDSFMPIIIRALGALVAFILSVVMARVLGLEEFGAYALIISVLMVLSIPVQAGIPTLVVREVSKAMAMSRKDTVSLIVGWTNRIIILYFFCLLCVSIAVFWIFNDTLSERLQSNFFIAIPAILLAPFLLRNSAVLRGLSHYVAGSFPEILLRPFMQLIAFGGLWLILRDTVASSTWAIAIFTIATGVAAVTSWVLMRKMLVRYGIDATTNSPVLPWWPKALWLLTLVGGGQVFFGHIDTLALGFFATTAEVGAYRVAVQISMLIILALTVVNQVLQPKFARLHEQGDSQALQKLVADSSWAMFVATVVPGIILLIIADPFLRIIFGADYTLAAMALRILVIGQCINVFFGSVGTLLNMTGFEREATHGMLIAIVINIMLDIIFIPPFGLEGAALASACSIAIWNAILRHFVKTRLGIESSGVVYRMKLLLIRLQRTAR